MPESIVPRQGKSDNESEDEKNQLKIQMAQIKVQAKKLKAELTDADENTRSEIEILINSNQEQLNDIIKKMTALNKPTNSKQER